VASSSSSSEPEPAPRHRGADDQRRARLDELAEARRQLDEELALLCQELGVDVEPRDRQLLTVKIRQPSHEFTFGVGISFIPYPLVLTPVV
jgi:hypothetical protein